MSEVNQCVTGIRDAFEAITKDSASVEVVARMMS